MPPYRYEPYHNPYAVSIAETLLHRNDPAARAAEVGGQAWAGAAQGIGQAATGLAGAVEQAPDVAQEREARAMQIDAEKRRLAAEQAMDSAFAGAMQPDGTLDHSKLFAHLPGHLVPGVMKSLTDIQKTAAELQESHQKVIKGNLDLAAGLLNGVRESGYDPKTFLQAVKTAGSYQLISPDEQTDLALGAIEQGPEFVKAKTDEYLSKSSEWQKLHNESITANARALTAQTGVERLQAELPKIGLETTRLQQETTGTVPITPAQRATTAIAAGNLDVARGRLDLERQQTEAAPELTEDAKNLTARQFAMTGQLPPMGMGKQGAKLRTDIINRAAEMYKGLDLPSQVAAYNANKESLKKLQTSRDAVGAFENTSKKNIDLFLEQAGKVADTGIPLVNTPTRWTSGQVFGASDVPTYNAARRVAINEIAKITSNPNLTGELSDTARKEVESFVPANATLKQAVDVMNLLKRDMDNRASSLDEQIQAVQQRIATPPGQSKTPEGGVSVGSTVTYQGQQYRVKAIQNGQAVLEPIK